MAGGINLASKYSNKVDERFTRKSQAMLALTNDYTFTGEKTVKVFSIPTVAMTDYARSGNNRYGSPNDLTRNVQSMTVTRDRAFTFIIDKGDKIQAEMVSDAGKALSRQLNEVCIPEFDTYVFRTLSAAATAHGNYSTAAITKTNAYEVFLAGQEVLGNKNVPDNGRVAFCSYKFANLLKQDSAFVKYGNLSQEMVIKGVLGEVDGTMIVKVPASRLPVGAAFLLVHPIAATAPKQLEDYKIHDNPPGISGWLVEGRMIYDAFVLNNKADGVYYHGSQPVLSTMNVVTAATAAGKSTILVEPGTPEAGHSFYYKTGVATVDVAYDNILSTAASGATANTIYGWTALPASGTEITPSASDTVVQVVMVKTADMKAKSVGSTNLNIG